jgi:hypothetical protein
LTSLTSGIAVRDSATDQTKVVRRCLDSLRMTLNAVE